MIAMMTNAELAQAIDQAMELQKISDGDDAWKHLLALLAVQRARAEDMDDKANAISESKGCGQTLDQILRDAMDADDKAKWDATLKAQAFEGTGTPQQCRHAVTHKVWRGNGIDSDTLCIRCGDKVGQTREISDPPPPGTGTEGSRGGSGGGVPKATKFD